MGMTRFMLKELLTSNLPKIGKKHKGKKHRYSYYDDDNKKSNILTINLPDFSKKKGKKHHYSYYDDDNKKTTIFNVEYTHKNALLFLNRGLATIIWVYTLYYIGVQLIWEPNLPGHWYGRGDLKEAIFSAASLFLGFMFFMTATLIDLKMKNK